MVLVSKDNVAGTFTTLEAGSGTASAKSYTYSSFTQHWRNFKNPSTGVVGYCYFFYIADLSSFGSSSPKYTITFDPNGGTVSPTTKMLTEGILLTDMPTPIRDGYHFLGWAMDKIDPNGDGTQVTTIVSDGVFTFDKDTTLYAHWTQDSHTHASGAYFYSDSHPHYKFYTCTTCGEVYTDGSTTNMSSCSICNPPEEKPIYTYTVTFDSNGGSVSPTTKTVPIGTSLTGMPTPTRSGYTFKGWAMDKIDPDGSGVSVTTIIADGVWTFDKDTTLYAHWAKEQNTSQPTIFDYSGKFGVNNALTWGLNTNTGVLVLSGNGQMQNWSNAEYRPWAKLRNTVTSVLIEDGIQNLGRYTLARFENMTSVSIPASVVEISDGVFTRAYSLASIELPQGLTTIGSGAFSECTSLRSITIPKNVDFIETGAFSGCTNLESIYFCGNAPSYFGDNGVVRLNMFSGCKNLTVYYPANSTGWAPIIEKYTDVTWKTWNPGNTSSPNSTPIVSNTPTWGTWSAWSNTPYSTSSTRQVETKQVKVSDAYTEYRYGLWRNASNASWCPNYGASLSSSGGSWYESYSSWSKTRMYQDTGHNAFCAGSNHNHTHVAGYDSSGQAYWNIYSDDGTFTGWGRLYYYWEETRTIPAVYETQYRYRDLIST